MCVSVCKEKNCKLSSLVINFMNLSNKFLNLLNICHLYFLHFFFKFKTEHIQFCRWKRRQIINNTHKLTLTYILTDFYNYFFFVYFTTVNLKKRDREHQQLNPTTEIIVLFCYSFFYCFQFSHCSWLFFYPSLIYYL